MIHPDVRETVSLEFSAKARIKSISGEKLYSLGLGEPFWKAPKAVRQKLSDVALNEHFGYKSPYGNIELRRLIAHDLTVVSHSSIKAEQVLISAGAKQALSIALKTILDDGDEVIIIDPCFVSYRPQVLLANHHAKIVPCPLTGSFKIDFDALNASFTGRTKAVFVNTPNNPSGGLITASEMAAIVALCKKNGAYLICDEIYRDFVYHDSVFVSANAFRHAYDRIVTIDGLSKTYGMTGWRLGYLVASAEFVHSAVKVVQHEMTNIPESFQVAACEAFRLPSGWFEEKRRVLEKNLDVYEEATKGLALIKNEATQAGMFVFPKFELEDLGSDEVAVALLKEESVAVTPGVTFGKNWDKYLRISLSSPDEEFQKAIEKFTRFFKKRQ